MKFKYLIFILLAFLLSLDNALSQVDLKKGLVACYPFTGDAKDNTGNGFNGSVSGAALSTDRFGNSNSCYYFDGVNDKIEVGGSVISKSEFTISFWSKTSSFGSVFAFMLVSDKPSDRFAISVNYNHNGDTAIYWDFGDIYSQGRWSVAGTYYSTQWEHYVFVVSNSSQYMSIYRDGNLMTKKTSAALLNNNEKTLNIGSGDGNGFFNGYIDDIHIYNRALSALEIDSLYKGFVCSSPLAVNDETLASDNFTISPNPASDDVIIRFNSEKFQKVNIDVLDATGQQVLELKNMRDGDRIVKSTLASGMYFYRAETMDGKMKMTGKLLLVD